MNVQVRIFFVSFLVLLSAASASSGTFLWGASSWRPVSFTVAIVLAAAMLLLLISRVRNGVSRILDISGRFSARTALVLAALSAALFWLFRYRHFLWGDRYSMGLAVREGSPLLPSAPLATIIYRGFYGIVNRLLLWNSFETSALLSVIAGILFAYASSAAIAAGRGSKKGWYFAGTSIILSGGYFAVFFGSGGSAPLAAAASALFILLSVWRIGSSSIPLLLPALAALLAIMTGISNIFVIPPLVYMILSAARQRGSRMEAAATIGTVLICWVAADMTASYFTGSAGPTSHMISAGGRTLSAMASAGAVETISLALNTLVMTGPLSVFAIVLLLTRRREYRSTDGSPAGTFLLLTALSALAMIFFVAPGTRGGLRWALAVPAAAAMTVFTVFELERRSPTQREFKASVAVLAALGLFHLAPIVATGTSLETGEKRLLDLPLSSGRAETIIGAQAWFDRDYDKAAKWWEKAVEKDPENAMLWHRLGQTDMKDENFLGAINRFHRASKLEPGSTQYRTALAEAYIAQRWFPEAGAELTVLVSQYPDSSRLWTRLGYARNHGGRFSDAIDAYETALALDPENKQYVMNLTSAVLNRGAELQREGDLDGARSMYRRARTLYPLNWVSLNNLAAIEIELENWGKALNYLTQGLKEHPEVHQIHFNMSIVLEKLGDYEEALKHLRSAARLDMLNPPPPEHLDRLLRKIEEQGQEP